MIFPPRLRDQVWKNNSQKGGKNLSKLPNSQVSQDVLKKTTILSIRSDNFK